MFDSSSKFLIVDDSHSTRQTVRKAFAELGLRNVDEAADGAIALKKLEESVRGTHYSLVLCDINMPNMTGFELLEKCRSNPDLADVPFLMATTESQKDAVIRAVMQGVTGYIVKPFGIQDMKEKIQETFNKMKKFNAASV